MARSPVTRAQVDAYRFGLRRMDAALVRRDPVPLHEDIRGQRRTVAAGLVLAMLGLAVAAVYGLIFPNPDWHKQTVVVGRQSGALYVVAHGPERLVPVANLAAARLVLAAISPDRAESGQVSPSIVEDATLADAPRTAAAAVPGAAAALPGAGPGLRPQWAVCDETSADRGRAVALSATTVVAGAAPQGRPIDGDRALLLRGSAGTAYLVHHGKRQRVELSDRRATAAFDLGGRAPRPAADRLLDAIPEATPLKVPDVVGAGEPVAAGVPGKVGDVVRSAPPGVPARFYVLLAGAVQQVSAPVAALLQSANPDASAEPLAVRWDLLSRLPTKAVLDVADYPEGPLRPLEPAEASTVCLAFAAADGKQAPEVVVGQAPPTPADRVPTRLAQADGPGPRLDAVYLPPGQGAAVRGVVPGQPADTGSLWLVSDTGVAYGVPDAESAAALGITGATAAPEVLLRLLPTGEPLSLAAARRTVDVLDPGPG